jgi:hypothetical protein
MNECKEREEVLSINNIVKHLAEQTDNGQLRLGHYLFKELKRCIGQSTGLN